MSIRSAPLYAVSVLQPGQDVEPVDLTDRVVSFTYTDNERKADTLQLEVDNEDLANFDDPVWARGNILRFYFGYADETSPIREAIIRKVTGGRTLMIESHARSVLMDRVSRRRRFDNMTRSDVVRQVAEENGFTGGSGAKGVHVDDTDEVMTITQANYTDAQLLRKLAHLEGFEFFIDFDGLHWHRRKAGQRPIRRLTYYVDPGIGSIIDFHVENDITRKPGRVRVRGRDPIKGKNIDVVAENATETGRDVLQEFPDIGTPAGDGTTEEEGGAQASTPIGSTAPRQGAAIQETAAQEATRPSNVQTENDARREAKGRFIKTQQSAVKMTMNIIGDPSIVAKSVVEVANMGRRLSGKYYVRAVEHTLSSNGGYETNLTLITDGFQQPLHGGRGKAGSASSAALNAARDALSVAIQETQVSDLTTAGLNVLQIVAPLAADPSSKVAAQVADRVSKLSRAAQSLGDPNVATTAAVLAAVIRRFIQVEEEQSEGNLNNKSSDQSDKGKLSPVPGADGTNYNDSMGRE